MNPKPHKRQEPLSEPLTYPNPEVKVPVNETSVQNPTEIPSVRQPHASPTEITGGVNTSAISGDALLGGSAKGLWHGFSGEARKRSQKQPRSADSPKGAGARSPRETGMGRVRLKQPKGQVLNQSSSPVPILCISSDRLSEADLVGELYHQCVLEGLWIKLEVPLPSKIHRSKTMRADAVLLWHFKVIAIVEVKSPGSITSGDTRQKRAYREIEREYGIPVFWLNDFEQIKDLTEKLVALVDEKVLA
jgi:hypothetical protein